MSEQAEKFLHYTIDAITGETIEREMTIEELAFRDAGQNAWIATEAALENKAIARVSALNKLAALGLTQEEIEAL
jgi:hypothetical protein